MSGWSVRLASFTGVLRRCGGIVVTVESAGIAHEWDSWFDILASDNPFDLYRSFVVLVADDDYFYSCGMHHFGLPDVEVRRSRNNTDAADLMNRFNYCQIVVEPTIQPGHTFSLTPEFTRYRITHRDDTRHEDEDVFNEAGVWRLTPTNMQPECARVDRTGVVVLTSGVRRAAASLCASIVRGLGAQGRRSVERLAFALSLAPDQAGP